VVIKADKHISYVITYGYICRYVSYD